MAAGTRHTFTPLIEVITRDRHLNPIRHYVTAQAQIRRLKRHPDHMILIVTADTQPPPSPDECTWTWHDSIGY
jgi:hypothetical protein